jgi:hypothetical protein
MISYKKQMKPLALGLVMIYLFLSAYMAVGAAEHDFKHTHTSGHSKQHSSFFCDWMCAAATFVHSADLNLRQGFDSSIESQVVYVEHAYTNLSIFSLRIRPPPFSIS